MQLYDTYMKLQLCNEGSHLKVKVEYCAETKMFFAAEISCMVPTKIRKMQKLS